MDAHTRRTRRQWLREGTMAMGAAAAASLTAPRSSGGEGDAAAQAIDAHVHVWTPDVERYPLAAGYSVADMEPRSFTPDELLALARPCGVARVVLIQMSFYGFDNRYMLDAMRNHPGVFSGVAVVDEHAGDVGRTMRELKRQGVRGFRIHPDTRPVEPWLASEGMAAMWKVGADEGLAMCALVNPEALRRSTRCARSFPRRPWWWITSAAWASMARFAPATLITCAGWRDTKTRTSRCRPFTPWGRNRRRIRIWRQ